MYFATAVAVASAGFHCLFFDGPGQGELLIEQGIPMRPDWETVIHAVDFALALPQVDPRRIASRAGASAATWHCAAPATSRVSPPASPTRACAR